MQIAMAEWVKALQRQRKQEVLVLQLLQQQKLRRSYCGPKTLQFLERWIP